MLHTIYNQACLSPMHALCLSIISNKSRNSRLDATQFKPSREHRKTLHRWENYVVGQGYLSECASKYPKTRESVIFSLGLLLPRQLDSRANEHWVSGRKRNSKRSLTSSGACMVQNTLTYVPHQSPSGNLRLP